MKASANLGNAREGRSLACWILGLTLAVLALGLAWRITRFVLGFPMWGDEAFIVGSLYDRGFTDMFRPLEHNQIAPLGFMWAELAVSETLGFSEWALRTPALFCGLFSMVLFWRFAWRVVDHRSAMLAVGIFAASYYIVRHANEVKPYSGDLAVSLLITYLGWAVYKKPISIVRWLGLTLAAALGIWLSYPAVFVAGAVAMLLLLPLRSKPQSTAEGFRGRLWVIWLLYVAVLVGSFLAMYLIYAARHEQAALRMTEIDTWQESFPPVERPWLLPWWFLEIHTGNMLAYPLGGKHFGSILTFILVIVGILALWRSQRKDLLIILLGPLPLTFIAAAMKKYPYGTSARISQYLAPAFCLLAGIGLAALLRLVRNRKAAVKAICIAGAFLALMTAVEAARDILIPTKQHSASNARLALRELAELTTSQDQWIIFSSLDDVPYAQNLYKYGGSGATFRYYVRRFGPQGVRWAPPPQSLLAPPAGKTWLLAYRDNKMPFQQDLFDVYRRAVREKLGPEVRRYWFELTSPKDPGREYTEAIEVYEFTPPD